MMPCINSAALLLARAKDRESEVSPASLSAASRRPVIAQLLLEALLLDLIDAVGGSLLYAAIKTL
jgi:hypothetical protein